jgi:ABC-2 type transport system ATP-binding protein
LINEDFVELGTGEGLQAKLQGLLAGLPGVRQVKPYDQHVQVFFEKGVMDTGELNRYCFENGITLTYLQLRKRSLESKFMELTEEKNKSGAAVAR